MLALVTFPLALAASAGAFLLAQELLHDRGYVAPAYPPVAITDPGAARAVVGTALLLTAYALIALGLGTVLRHAGAAIAASVAVVFLPLLASARSPITSRRASSSSRRSRGWRSSRRPAG